MKEFRSSLSQREPRFFNEKETFSFLDAATIDGFFFNNFIRIFHRLSRSAFLSLHFRSLTMSTTYDYSYDYDVDHSNRNTRKTTNNNQPSNRYSNNHQTNPAVSTTTYSDRLNNMDPLVNLQHDRIWNKLYDPVDSDRIAHDAEAQVGFRRKTKFEDIHCALSTQFFSVLR